MDGPDTADAALAALTDRERLARAAEERGRERWLRQQAAEGARLADLLVSAGQRGDLLTISTTGGATHRGTVAAVTRCAVVVTAAGADTILPLRAVAVVEGSTAGMAADARPDPAGEQTFAEVLVERATPGALVRLGCGAAGAVTGTVGWVGVDVLAIKRDGGAVTHVALDSVTEVVLASR